MSKHCFAFAYASTNICRQYLSDASCISGSADRPIEFPVTEHYVNASVELSCRLPVEVVALIIQFYNVASQGPVASEGMVRSCLQYAGLQAMLLTYCTNGTEDDESYFWTLPRPHCMQAAASFACRPRLRAPVPRRATLAIPDRLLCSTRGSVQFDSDKEEDTDILGGSSLPESILNLLVVHHCDPEFLFQAQACCRSIRRAILSPDSWANDIISLLHVDFRNVASLSRTILCSSIWRRAAMVIIPDSSYPCMRSSGLLNMRVQWSAVHRHARDIFTFRSWSWNSEHRLYGVAEMVMTVTEPLDMLVVGAFEPGAVWPATGRGPEFFCRIHKPFQTGMRLALGASGLPGCMRFGPVDAVPSVSRHYIKLTWTCRRLQVMIDDTLFPGVRLQEQLPDGPGQHSKVFARAFASRRTCHSSVQLQPLPSKLPDECSLSCSRCRAAFSPHTSGSACALCQRWFCDAHGPIAAENAGVVCCSGCQRAVDFVGGSIPAEQHGAFACICMLVYVFA